MSFTAVPIQMQIEGARRCCRPAVRAIYTSSRLILKWALHLGLRLLTQTHKPTTHYMPEGYCGYMMVAPRFT